MELYLQFPYAFMTSTVSALPVPVDYSICAMSVAYILCKEHGGTSVVCVKTSIYMTQ